MPRGIPKDRPDETAMKFTSFFIPPPMNSKNAASSYLKSETQTLWWRNAQNGGTAGGKRKRSPELVQPAPIPEGAKRGSDVIVIHPGSRYLRLGRASDHTSVTIPHVIARKRTSEAVLPSRIHSIPPFSEHPSPKVVVPPPPGMPEASPDYEVEADPNDPTDMSIAGIRANLRARMFHFDQIAVLKDGAARAAQFNKSLKPTIIPVHKDPDFIDWLNPESTETVFIGKDVFRIADPVKSKYAVRWPFRGGRYNHADYNSRNEVMGDIEAIWTTALRTELDIDIKNAKDFSVILVVPDYPDKLYIRDMAHLLLVQLGFRRICVQQESVCSAFGASIAHGCVVDVGAMKTSVSCVEEGLVLAETRMSLDYGGDDISELYLRLLERINLPYRTADLCRTYDWSMMEDLKCRSASLAEEDVVLIEYDLFVRQPGRPTEKYTLQTYDEPAVSSMVLFDPAVIDFDAKRAAILAKPWSSPSVEEMDVYGDAITTAMHASTHHLIAEYEASKHAHHEHSANISIKQEADAVEDVSTDIVMGDPDVPTGSAPSAMPTAVMQGDSRRASLPPLDIRFEASKIPLDLAIYHSINASTANAGSGGADRLKKMLSCILVVGGTALTPGMLNALDSRLRGLFAANLPGHEELVAIIPAPKSIDPRVLAWKGASVLAKLDSVNDMWTQQGDWEMIGMRALRDRSFFL